MDSPQHMYGQHVLDGALDKIAELLRDVEHLTDELISSQKQNEELVADVERLEREYERVCEFASALESDLKQAQKLLPVAKGYYPD